MRLKVLILLVLTSVSLNCLAKDYQKKDLVLSELKHEVKNPIIESNNELLQCFRRRAEEFRYLEEKLIFL